MKDRPPLKKVVSATEVRNKLGILLSRVYRSKEHLVVEKLGIPVAVIISMQDYEEYERLLAQHRLIELGRRVGQQARRQNLSEEQLQEELKESRRQVFRDTYSDFAQ